MNKRIIYIFISIILLALVALPKNYSGFEVFNKLVGNGELSYVTPDGIHYSGLSPDRQSYYYAIEYFKGNESGADLAAPFAFRVIPLYLASMVGLSPSISLDIVNMIFLYIGLIFLALTLKKLKYTDTEVFIGTLLYNISFPMFYNGMSGGVDPVAIGFLMVILYYSISNNFLFVLSLLAIAAGIKETLIITIPIASGLYYIKSKSISKSILYTFSGFIVFYLSGLFFKSLIPIHQNYSWNISYLTLVENLLRPRMYISFILSFGFVGILSIYYMANNYHKLLKIELNNLMVFGFISGLSLWVYAVLTAYADGRFVWYMYPFSIILSLESIRMIKHKRANINQITA